MINLILRPTASSAAYPKMRSAALFQVGYSPFQGLADNRVIGGIDDCGQQRGGLDFVRYLGCHPFRLGAGQKTTQMAFVSRRACAAARSRPRGRPPEMDVLYRCQRRESRDARPRQPARQKRSRLLPAPLEARGPTPAKTLPKNAVQSIERVGIGESKRKPAKFLRLLYPF